MRLGYNTNGLAHHRLLDALDFLADEGYESVAITLDAGALDPYADRSDLVRQIDEVRDRLDRLGLIPVIETGARYLLNPRKKHDPNLMDADPTRRHLRVDFLKRSIDIAVALDSPMISFWSGALNESIKEEVAMDRLASGIREVLDHAEQTGIILAFEPEPGMFLDTFARFRRLDTLIDHPLFQLTVDIGHVHCLEKGEVADHIRRWGSRIANVHIEDMIRGVHDHLMFGEGTIDFVSTLRALREVGYQGGLNVELSRHSHAAVDAVRKSARFLRPILEQDDRKIGGP